VAAHHARILRKAGIAMMFDWLFPKRAKQRARIKELQAEGYVRKKDIVIDGKKTTVMVRDVEPIKLKDHG